MTLMKITLILIKIYIINITVIQQIILIKM